MVETGAWEKTSHTHTLKKSNSSRAQGDRGCWRWTKNVCVIIFVVVFPLWLQLCVQFLAWDEDQKAQNKNNKIKCLCANSDDYMGGSKSWSPSFALLVRFIRLNTLKTRRETGVTWTYSWVSITVRGKQIWQISMWTGASVTLDFSNQECADAHLSSQHGWGEIVYVGGEYQAI